MKNNIFRLLPLAVAVAAGSVHALESMDDGSLGAVEGQAGLTLALTGPSLTVGDVAWVDDGGTLTSTSTVINPYGSSQYGVTLNSNIGASGTNSAMSLDAIIKPMTMSTTLGVSGETGSFFEAALRTTADSQITYLPSIGLFGATSKLVFNIPAAQLFLAQTYSSARDVLSLTNVALQGSYTGAVQVDATNGFNLAGGALNLTKLFFDINWEGNQASGFAITNTGGGGRIGVVGDLSNFSLGIKGGGNTSITTGGTYTNAKGITAFMSGNLSTSTLKAYLGNTGTGAYGVEFGKFVPLSNYNGTNPFITTGTVTLDVLKSGDTLPDLGTGYGLTLGAGKGSLGLTVRGFNFQTYPTSIDFYNFDTSTAGAIQNWSLMTSFYNVNANMILSPGGHWNAAVTPKRGIGYNLSLSTTANDGTGSANTIFGVADTTAHKYLGLRNIDLRLKVNQGQLYILDSTLDSAKGLRIAANDMTLALSSQFAIGDLPDGTKKFNVAADGATAADHLFSLGVNLGLLASGGSASFTLSPTSTTVGTVSYLGYSAAIVGLDPAQTSITITEPTDATQAKFGNISGDISIVNGSIPITNNSVTFQQTTVLGSLTNPLTASNVSFNKYNSGTGTYTNYTLGKIAIPGAQLYSSLKIFPQ